MRFGSRIPTIPTVDPLFNVGCMLDIPTGSYHLGKYGQSILNGGWGAITSIIGIGHSFKSTTLMKFLLAVTDRIAQVDTIVDDTENVGSYTRLNELAAHCINLSKINFCDPNDLRRDRFQITSSSMVDANGKVMLGDVFHDQVTKFAKEVYADKKAVYYTTPFRQGHDPVKIRKPTLISYDSLTKMRFSSIESGKKADCKLGDSERNTVDLDNGRLKTQLNNSLPGLSKLGEIRFSLTAHTQKDIKMEGKFGVDKPKLTHGKREYDIKGVGTSFIQINEVILDIQSVTKFNNDVAKTGVYYPLIDTDREENCKDLNLLTAVITRNKHGATGFVYKYVMSQREGLLEHLSMFKFIKDSSFYGLVGNDKRQTLVLVPEITVQRTTVRKAIDDSYKLRRALEVTSDLLQIYYLFSPEGKKLLCTPQELYTDLIAMGYNWDTLLSITRSFWVFEEEDNNNLPPLTTMDLLRMRAGLYVPYWLNPSYIEQSEGYLKEILTSIPKEQLRV